MHGGDEERLEKVYNELYSLQDFLDPKNYKSYAELKAKMNKVLGVSGGVEAAAPSYEEVQAPVQRQVSSAYEASDDVEVVADTSTDSEEDTLSYFAKLAKE